MKLLIICNNARWNSWPEKIEHLADKLKKVEGIASIFIDLNEYRVKNIPLEEEPDESREYQLKRSWINNHLPIEGYDLLLFVVTQKDWKRWGGDSVNAGRFYKDIPVAYVIADEHTTLKRRDGKTYNRFLTVAEHELQHLLCKLTNQPDLTHAFRDNGDLEGMWSYLSFNKEPMEPTRFLYQPVSPWVITQRFGEKGACIHPVTRKVIRSNNGVCPAPYRSVYPPAGHTGLDLRAKRWQPIYAAAGGIVFEVSTEPERGLGIGIVTQEKYWCRETQSSVRMKHRYWHLIALDVAYGEVIKRGQFIGYADSTGYSTADHLHFELKPVALNAEQTFYNLLQNNGSYGAINPEPYLNNNFALTGAPHGTRERIALLADKVADFFRYG